MLPAVKRCSRCRKYLSIDCFYKHSGAGARKSGVQPRCKNCNREVVQERRIQKPGEEYTRRKNWQFNLAPGVYQGLIAIQNNLCAICGKEEVRIKQPLSIDHDRSCCPDKRSCGKCIRGLLCMRCNVGLAYLENKVWTASALEYLSQPYIENEKKERY